MDSIHLRADTVCGMTHPRHLTGKPAQESEGRLGPPVTCIVFWKNLVREELPRGYRA